jgi:hypothetical protein
MRPVGYLDKLSSDLGRQIMSAGDLDERPEPASTSALEDIVERFERDWRTGRRPCVGDYLPAGAGRRRVLVELVHTDLELRLKAGEMACVEGYLGRYPELAEDVDAVFELIVAECRFRQAAEAKPVWEEYERRFPGYADRLAAKLSPAREGEPSTDPSGATDVGASTPQFESAADGPPTRAETALARATPSNPRFRILRPHRRGGLGQVFVALDAELNREVALKEIQDCHADDLESRRRFLLEAEVTGALEHPGVVPVYALRQ